MPIALQQFTNVVRNPLVPDNTVLKSTQKKNGSYEVTYSTTNFFGRTVSWLKKAGTSEQHAAGREECSQTTPLTQTDLLRSIASKHGADVALDVQHGYGSAHGDPSPLTKYKVRQVLNHLNRIRTRSNFDRIPTEVTEEILRNLPVADLMTIQLAEKKFIPLARHAIKEDCKHKLTNKMVLGYQKKAMETVEQRSKPTGLFRKSGDADKPPMNREAMFQSQLTNGLEKYRPHHVSLELDFLQPKLRPIVLQTLMNCNYLQQLDLELTLYNGRSYKQTFDELGATLPLACMNNPGLQIGIAVKSRGSFSFPAELHMDEFAKLTDLPNITSLELSQVGLNDDKVAMLDKLQDLRHLTIAQEDVTEQNLEIIGGLPNLESLVLRAPHPVISVEKMQIIGGMHHLQELGLLVAGVNTENLAAFADAMLAGTEPSSLRKLNFYCNTGVTDAAVPHLLRLPSMERINLEKCKIGDEGALALASAHIDKIQLKDNPIGFSVKTQIKAKHPHVSISD
jgi:hypothetical protein